MEVSAFPILGRLDEQNDGDYSKSTFIRYLPSPNTLHTIHSKSITGINFYVVQEGILRVHPDLAGRLATNGQLTKESSSEQSQANLNQLTPEEKATLAHLNDNYKSKFGFPFVICARLNKKEAIMVGLQRRLNHSSDIEVKNGIAEVLKICELRLKDIVKNC